MYDNKLKIGFSINKNSKIEERKYPKIFSSENAAVFYNTQNQNKKKLQPQTEKTIRFAVFGIFVLSKRCQTTDANINTNTTAFTVEAGWSCCVDRERHHHHHLCVCVCCASQCDMLCVWYGTRARTQRHNDGK